MMSSMRVGPPAARNLATGFHSLCAISIQVVPLRLEQDRIDSIVLASSERTVEQGTS